MAAPYQFPPFSPEGIAMNGTQYAPGSPEAAVMNGSRPAPPKAPPINMAVTKPKYTNVASGPANNSLAPKASDFPNVTGLASDMTSNVDDAIKHGDIAGAVGRTTAGMAAMIPAAGVDIYQGLKGAFMPAVGAAQRFAAGVTGGAVSPPTRAGSAAAAAAAKAVEDPIHDNGGPSAPAGGSAGGSAPAGQPLPGFDKASGMAAINEGGGPRQLNYGPGSTIYGESVNGSKKRNSFYGPGAGPTPAGAAAPAAAAGSGNPMQQAQAHLVDIMNQASALRARGDISGALQARGLESHAARMGALFTALGQHSYQQGVLGVQNREAALREQVAHPGTKIEELKAAAIGAGKLDIGRKIKAAESGQNLEPAQAIPAMGYVRDPNTGEMKWVGFPTDAFAH